LSVCGVAVCVGCVCGRGVGGGGGGVGGGVGGCGWGGGGGQLVSFGRPSYVPWPCVSHGSVIDIWHSTVACNSDSIYCASCSLCGYWFIGYIARCGNTA